MQRAAALLFSVALASPSHGLLASRSAAPRRATSIRACASATLDLYDPATRASNYNGKIAKYLVDLHDADATFDFCGGMMFQLVLSPALRAHLAQIHPDSDAQPKVQPASTNFMAKMDGYSRSAEADDISVFHGREVRNVDWAAGGRGFAIHLSLAGEDDAEGWTPEEIAGYDGWGHDSGRVWRDGQMLEGEGFSGFRSKFGERAFTLHHRFYMHLGADGNLWLSAEDGCEGQVARSPVPRNKAAPWWPF